MINRALDTLLDRSIVGGYSRLGFAARQRWWAAIDEGALDGRVVAITGATSGIGQAAVERLARGGARLALLVRDPERGAELCAALSEHAVDQPPSVHRCDLGSLDSVRTCAESIATELPAVDVLIHNAGILPEQRELSSDGIELCFATNVVGPFLLTALLAPVLAGTGAGRIITVSSGGMYSQRLRADDLQMEHEEFDGVTAYARSKRAQAILSEMWSQRLAPEGIACHAMHPGWVDTPGLRTSLPRFRRVVGPLLRTPEQGADTIVWLAAAPSLPTGCFWHDRRRRPVHLVPGTREDPGDRARLWEECETLSGLRDG
jgi:NAD(P)-dependent dehydrogenase (short-subunit alcohol dehydrogenase family)